MSFWDKYLNKSVSEKIVKDDRDDKIKNLQIGVEILDALEKECRDIDTRYTDLMQILLERYKLETNLMLSRSVDNSLGTIEKEIDESEEIIARVLRFIKIEKKAWQRRIDAYKE